MCRIWLGVALLVGLAQASSPCPDCDPPDERLPWSWLDDCHVQRAHQLTSYGTRGSLFIAGDFQSIVSPSAMGKNRAGYTYIGTLEQDLWSGGALIAYAHGGTAYTLDQVIEDRLGTNGLAAPADLYISRLFVLQNLPAQHLQIAAGRIDLSDFFDTNRVANCETTQFLATSLVNNPAIPFSQAGLGAAVRWSFTSWGYVQAGIGNASAVATQSDLDTAFHRSNNAFSIAEVGLSPFPKTHEGQYRFIFWRSPAPETNEAGGSNGNYGFALSFDQSATDTLTLFLRYGYADIPLDGLSRFYSGGARLDSPLPGRSHDFLQCALAVGTARLHTETLAEIGYHLQIDDDLSITPLVQVIANPGDRVQTGTLVVAGLRAVCVF